MSQSRAGGHCQWAVQEYPAHQQEAMRCPPSRVSKREERGLTGKSKTHSKIKYSENADVRC